MSSTDSKQPRSGSKIGCLSNAYDGNSMTNFRSRVTKLRGSAQGDKLRRKLIFMQTQYHWCYFSRNWNKFVNLYDKTSSNTWSAAVFPTWAQQQQMVLTSHGQQQLMVLASSSKWSAAAGGSRRHPASGPHQLMVMTTSNKWSAAADGADVIRHVINLSTAYDHASLQTSLS